MEQILYRIKKYSEEALHYPVGTFHHNDAFRLLSLAIVELHAAQQNVQLTLAGVCLNCERPLVDGFCAPCFAPERQSN